MPPRPEVMLIVETSMIYGREVLRGINRYVVTHQPWSLSLEPQDLMVAPPAWLDSWDGGVISRSTTPWLAEKLQHLQIPTVDLTDIYTRTPFPHIWTDHHQVGRLAASHLLERGFRHFAFCGFAQHEWSSRRHGGFREAIGQAGLDCAYDESPWATSGDYSWEEQQEQLAVWIQSLPKPVGVMACNDRRGQQVLDACRRIEVAVPEEVAVIGVDNDELLCDLCDPPLSSVVPNAERVGYEAAALLDRLMRGETLEQSEWLIEPLGIITRQSTDVLAIDDRQVASAVRFIREHACEGIGVDDVLRHVPLSRSVLERRFRKYLKRSPQIEIRSVQMKRVKQLLAETDLPLERIASLAGFEHPEYMSVVFKRETGQTPGQYRRATQV
ncbi:MAG TPA: DNA-binding transcriptional regulator [Planctomycetaceae bacterium]|nr:DNA-binding transcriptional regulator [Planctomycetaceae bacterium]